MVYTSMQDFGLTFVLVAAHLLIYIIAFWLTRRPLVTVFHLVLATHVLAFVLRPSLAALTDGYMLYPVSVSQGWSWYNLGLVYELLFMLFYVAGYLAGRRRAATPLGRPPVSVVRGYWFSLSLGILLVAMIHVLSHGAWLPTVRSSTITSVVPYGKLLFIAVIPLSMTLPLGYLVIRTWPRLWPIVVPGCVVSLVALSLLYQRGFVISGIILVLFLWDRYSRLGYIQALVVGVTLMALLAELRPFANVLSSILASGTPVSYVPSAAPSLMEKVRSFMLFSPNFDAPDVWPVAIAWIHENGLALGSTFAAIPARVLTPGLRRELGLTTAVDLLNEYYWGEHYWTTNFGFNVSLSQELFLNWGPLSLVVSFIPGLLTAKVDRWLWRFTKVNVMSIYVVAAAFATGGFSGELGGIMQWGLAYIALGYVLSVMARLSFFRRKGRAPAVAPQHSIN